MHSLTDYEANIPAFLAKLWNMVEDPSSDELIAWGTNGLSFVIKDQSKFAKELLPMYYKHNNMASFIRQLNMYGFHKNLSLESGCAKMEEVIIEFYHPCFQKDQPSLLPNIKRKINSARSSAGASNTATVASQTDVVNQVLHDVRKMKSRQDSVDSRLTQMKIENEALWREVAILRQKHMKQQQIVNKLIQFLVSIVQHPHGLSVKRRNLPLMLQDRSATSKQLQQNTNNQSLSGISEITRSPSGPVIHEIDPSDYAASLLLNEVRVDDGITSPQDATILMDNPASQESVADNDETLATADVVAVDAGDGDLEGSELLDLPNQLLLADADAVASDEIADETRSEAANSSDGQNESVFTRPNQIRASKRRPRKPAATKKLSYQVQVADNPQQPDITGLVLDDFPLIIPGSQALQELTSAAESTADDVTTQSPVYIETLTSPPNVNLTADPLVESPASLYGDGSDLGEFVDPNQVIINAPTIVNCPMPIVTPEKTAKFKKIVPKPDQSQPRVKTIRPLQSKRKMPPPLKTTAAGKKSKQMTGDKSTTPIALLAATTNLPTSVGKTRTPIGSPCNVANLPAAPSATVSKQMAEQSSENSDRTVACMSPSNSQQSLKYTRGQDFNNSYFKPQEIDSHVDSMQSDLETLKELLKGESISLDANTLLGLFNSEDPFSLTMDLPSQTQSQEDKLKEPDNKIVSYSTANNQELNDIFGDYNDWILSSPGNEALNEDDDVYNIPELNTPDILLTPDPMLPPASKKKKK